MKAWKKMDFLEKKMFAHFYVLFYFFYIDKELFYKITKLWQFFLSAIIIIATMISFVSSDWSAFLWWPEEIDAEYYF